MEVLCYAHNKSLILRDSFDFVAPFPGNFDSSLNSLRSRVHRQYHIKAKEVGDKFGKAREDIVVEGSRAQGQSRGLLCQRLHEFWVAVTLIDGAVGTQEVQILLTLGIPDGCSGGSGKNYRKWVVVVGGMRVLAVDGLLR